MYIGIKIIIYPHDNAKDRNVSRKSKIKIYKSRYFILLFQPLDGWLAAPQKRSKIMPNVTHQMHVSTPRRQKEITTFECRTIETQDVR